MCPGGSGFVFLQQQYHIMPRDKVLLEKWGDFQKQTKIDRRCGLEVELLACQAGLGGRLETAG